jgi:hypothetical protein
LKLFIRSALFGTILFSFYLLLWKLSLSSLLAFIISLVITATISSIYGHKINLKIKYVIQLSVGSGIAFISLAWVGITLFPPTVIRDIGDIVYPYLKSLEYGLITIVIIPLFNLFKF